MDAKMRAWRWRILSSTWLCYAGFYFCRKPFYVAKATMGEEFGWSAPMLGQAGATYLICYTIGQFMAGVFGDKLGPRVVLLTGLAVTIGCNVAFGLADSFGTNAARRRWERLTQKRNAPTNSGSKNGNRK